MSTIPSFDPSKMDPKVLMELSQLVQQLSPTQMNRLQTLMHNMMAGIDVKRDMEEFEKTLPPGFREKLVTLMASQGGAGFDMGMGMGMPSQTSSDSQTSFGFQDSFIDSSPNTLSPEELNLREARLTVLRAVAQGSMSPDEAEKILFKET